MVGQGDLLLLSDSGKGEFLVEELDKLGFNLAIKKKNLTALNAARDSRLVFFDVENKPVEKNLLQQLKMNLPYHPIIAVLGQEQDMKIPDLAALSNAILRTPYTTEALNKVLSKFLQPQLNEKCRIHDRINVDLRVLWRFRDNNGGLQKEGRILNLSKGGAFITEDSLPPSKGEIVELLINGMESLHAARAVVRWVSSKALSAPGFGVEFISMDQALKNSLQQLV